MFSTISSYISNFIWSWLFFPGLIVCAGALTISCRGLQFRRFGLAMRLTVGSIRLRPTARKSGTVTPFQAAATALGSTVGTGNIVGVSQAIAMGGPGALFWLWAAALIGMIVKYAEVALAIYYRRGSIGSGPMDYITHGLGRPPLARVYGVLVTLSAFCMGNLVQVSSIADSFVRAVDACTVGPMPSPAALRFALGLVLAAVTALLARRLTRPLAVLTDAGAQIAAGDYARRTDLHTGDEIEALSRSFDKMADAVQEKIADLEADVQRREDFVGAFTHELKTPMTSIIGYADMLHTMQTDPDEQREAAAAIVHEGRRLEALSRKLLALLGLNEEGVELTAVPLPALWPRLHAACPDVTLRTPTAAPTVRGDADLLLDLLCNLVQNAAKASAPGAPVLVLCAQAGDAVTLTVADRGCGIPPELIPRVTEPFYMVDKSRARRQGGSGLGLALCQRIAAAHGSALRIESEPGRGTRVSVTLPVWKEDAP